MILTAAVIATLLLIAGFAWGQRVNLRFAHEVATLLETLAEPEEVEYLWLGGVLGFRAEYRQAQHLEGHTLAVTLLMLPRHAFLYWPIAWLRQRGDRLLLTLPVPRPCEPPAPVRRHLRNLTREDQALTLDLQLPRRGAARVLESVFQWLTSCL